MAELVVRSAGIRKFLGSNPIRHFYKKKKFTHRFEVGGYKRWTNDGQLMDNPWINASSREFTDSSIGCAYRAELILGR